MNSLLLRRLPLLAAVVFVPAGTASAATPTTLTRAMTGWTSAHPATGIHVVRLDASGPTVVLSYKPDVPRRPASTMKIVTAAAALVAYGPNHRFVTGLYSAKAPAAGSNTLTSTFYLKGGGDPMLATPSYIKRYIPGYGTPIDGLAVPLRRAGLTRLNGRLVIDERRFDSARRVASWPARYVVECAPLSAVNVNQGFLLDRRTRYVRQPQLSAAARLRQAFTRRGVTHTGSSVGGRTPSGAHLLASVSSPPLSGITRAMLPNSDNYIAETLTKSTGAQVTGVGSTAGGTAAARTVLASWIGARNRLVDGSGLDRANALTPRSMVRLLTAANGDPTWGAALLQSLPRGGEGTLVRRFTSPSLRSRVRAKTGYIASTSTLAGVVDSRNGVRYAFALYMNDDSITAAKQTQDRIVALLGTGIADNS